MTREENKILIERYPFLQPGKWDIIYNDMSVDEYDYQFTLLDDMPKAWRDKFGLQMCEEIRDILLKADYLDKYQVVQIKEKFGSLRWYDNGVPELIARKLYDCIDKYEALSADTCFDCGASPTVAHTKGWIVYLCIHCAQKHDNIVWIDKYKMLH